MNWKRIAPCAAIALLGACAGGDYSEQVKGLGDSIGRQAAAFRENQTNEQKAAIDVFVKLLASETPPPPLLVNGNCAQIERLIDLLEGEPRRDGVPQLSETQWRSLDITITSMAPCGAQAVTANSASRVQASATFDMLSAAVTPAASRDAEAINLCLEPETFSEQTANEIRGPGPAASQIAPDPAPRRTVAADLQFLFDTTDDDDGPVAPTALAVLRESVEGAPADRLVDFATAFPTVGEEANEGFAKLAAYAKALAEMASQDEIKGVSAKVATVANATKEVVGYAGFALPASAAAGPVIDFFAAAINWVTTNYLQYKQYKSLLAAVERADVCMPAYTNRLGRATTLVKVYHLASEIGLLRLLIAEEYERSLRHGTGSVALLQERQAILAAIVTRTSSIVALQRFDVGRYATVIEAAHAALLKALREDTPDAEELLASIKEFKSVVDAFLKMLEALERKA